MAQGSISAERDQVVGPERACRGALGERPTPYGMSQGYTPTYPDGNKLGELLARLAVDAEPDVAPDSVLAEVGAMQRIAIILDHLDVTTQRRVVRWVAEKFQTLPGRESE